MVSLPLRLPPPTPDRTRRWEAAMWVILAPCRPQLLCVFVS